MRKWLVTSAMVALLALSATPAAAQARIPRMPDGKPNLNGLWMSNGLANWDLEPHGPGPSTDPKLGSIYAVPPSVGYVVGGSIPYKPAALEQKKKNFAARAKEDPEAKCFMGGVPRANYMPYPLLAGAGAGVTAPAGLRRWPYSISSANTTHLNSNNRAPSSC